MVEINPTIFMEGIDDQTWWDAQVVNHRKHCICIGGLHEAQVALRCGTGIDGGYTRLRGNGKTLAEAITALRKEAMAHAGKYRLYHHLAKGA